MRRMVLRPRLERGAAAPERKAGAGAERAAAAVRIHHVPQPDPGKTSDVRSRPGLPTDESRSEMMRRVKGMTVEERLALFERLSRRVTWARSAKRIR